MSEIPASERFKLYKVVDDIVEDKTTSEDEIIKKLQLLAWYATHALNINYGILDYE